MGYNFLHSFLSFPPTQYCQLSLWTLAPLWPLSTSVVGTNIFLECTVQMHDSLSIIAHWILHPSSKFSFHNRQNHDDCNWTHSVQVINNESCIFRVNNLCSPKNWPHFATLTHLTEGFAKVLNQNNFFHIFSCYIYNYHCVLLGF